MTVYCKVANSGVGPVGCISFLFSNKASLSFSIAMSLYDQNIVRSTFSGVTPRLSKVGRLGSNVSDIESYKSITAL